MKPKLLLFFILVGCTSTLTPEDIEWNKGIDIENWEMCLVAIRNRRDATIHMDHDYRHRHLGHWDIRNDLEYNRCRERLGYYWIRK